MLEGTHVAFSCSLAGSSESGELHRRCRKTVTQGDARAWRGNQGARLHDKSGGGRDHEADKRQLSGTFRFFHKLELESVPQRSWGEENIKDSVSRFELCRLIQCLNVDLFHESSCSRWAKTN